MTGAIQKLEKKPPAIIELEANASAIIKVSPLEPTRAERSFRICLALAVGPRLSRCTPRSIVSSVYNVMCSSLDPNPALGECYIIPYQIKGVYLAQFQLGYPGIIRLARNGGIYGIRPALVYEGDHFDYMGGRSVTLEHRPAWLDGKEQGKMIGSYVAWQDPPGHSHAMLMSAAQLEKRRRISKQWDAHAWKNWPEEQYLKTSTIYTGKRCWPRDTALARAIATSIDSMLDDPHGSTEAMKADGILIEDIPTDTERLNAELGGE